MDNETIELTELHDINVSRQDGVEHPASGFSFIVKKSVAKGDGVMAPLAGTDGAGCGCCAACSEGDGAGCSCASCPDHGSNEAEREAAAKDVNAVGGIDEQPDIDGAHQVLCELYKLIEQEAREGAVGADEHADIQCLAEAICLVQYFLQCETWSGEEDDGSGIAKAEALAELDEFVVAKAHRKFSSADRKSLAAEGKALPDGSYPIPDVDALRRAAILARSGHGDVAAAKRLIAKRARELGVPNPLTKNDNTQKEAEVESAPVETSADEATAKSEDSALTAESVQEMIKAALGERASEAEKLTAENAALKSELDVLKATPIPGGPSLMPSAEDKAVKAKSEAVKKAAYWKRMAEMATDRDLAVEYSKRASAEMAAAE